MSRTPTTYSRLSTDAYRTLHAIGRSNLRGELKHLLTVIAGPFYDYKDGDTYPSVPRIAQYMGVCLRHVQDLVNEAVEHEVLVVQRTRGGVGKTNHYQLVPEKLIPLTDEQNAAKGYPSSLPNPAHHAGLQRGKPRTLAHQTPHATTSNPAPGAGEQPTEQPKEQPQRDVVALLRGLGVAEDAIGHPNATPELMSALYRAAIDDPKVKDKAAWIAKGLIARWDVSQLARGTQSKQHTPRAQRLRGGLT